MKINERLNLVVPVYQADGTTVYVHSMPIGPEVFDTHFMVLAKTFSAIHNEGLGSIAGPRVAAKLLRRVAASMGDAEALAVENGLLGEVRRLTNVLVPSGAGWETVPFQEIVNRKTIDPEDMSEVENAIVFFIVSSAMMRREALKEFLPGAARLWGAQIVSSNVTEFAASLPTSKPEDSSGAEAAPGTVTTTTPSGETAAASSLPV